MKIQCKYFSLLVGTGFVVLLYAPFLTWAATAPDLGQANSFGVLAGSAVTNTGPTVIVGDLGVSPDTSVTGFPPGIVIGAIHSADAVAGGAQSDVTIAYSILAGQACNTTISADLGGTTLIPGVYCSASSMGLTGTLTLDAQGNPNAVFIFQIGSTLTTASNSSVRLINGAQSCNVFWQIGSSATLGTDTTFIGNMLALTSITLTTGASVDGRALARNGAVTLDSNAVTVPACSLSPAPITPTLGKAFSPATTNAGAVSTLTITLSNPDTAPAILATPLTDTLPSGLVIATPPNVGTTCGGGPPPVAVAGGSTVTLPAGRSIPANGSCTLTVDVTAAIGGSYTDTLLANALMTSNGNNAGPAVATLTVIPPLAAASIPTLSEWAMIMLAGLLVLFGVAGIRRHAR